TFLEKHFHHILIFLVQNKLVMNFLIQNYFLIVLENTKPPSKPPKGQFCTVWIVGGCLESGFVI
ncbi:hypothetical protein KFY46_26140, partial [Salmonella enterica subsp. enterica serovar 1,4,[5],12:i:-]|nr:hypothetical protein [Salmonella enterica subsp. enterica serovar 1,4,[5],12:i:-]